MRKQKKGFSLVELIIVVVIIGILSGVAYIGIQKSKSKTMNDKALDDLIAIANAMEQYKRDHFGEYPFPTVSSDKMNLNCFYADATYAHDCDESGGAAFVQGMIDNNLLTKRYLTEVPTDPRTGSRYVYGVSTDKKYFQVAGIYKDGDDYIAKTVGNVGKGYHLPSLIRAYDGPNFVVENGSNLPYSPNHMTISATVQDINGLVQIKRKGEASYSSASNEDVLYAEDYVKTGNPGAVNIYFSDGSVSYLDSDTELLIKETLVAENNSDSIITKIRLKLFSGKIWNKVARLAESSEFNIETTNAIAGVRGTEFGVDASDIVLMHTGSICSFDRTANIDPTMIEHCNPTDNAILFEDEEVDVVQNLATGNTASTSPGSTALVSLKDEQTKRYLNDNIRPRILLVDADTSSVSITIENINTYHNVPEGENLEFDTLSVYYVGSSSPLAPLPRDPTTREDYTFTLTSIPSGPVVFRFENGTDGPHSGYSTPITITSETYLTEDDIYSVDESGEGEGEGELGCEGVPGISGYVQMVPDDTSTFDATIFWTVGPACAFEGKTYDVYFDNSDATTLVKTDLNDTQHPMPDLAEGTYYWKVQVNGDTSISATGSKSTPTGDVSCGDGIRQLEENGEQCDGGIGCIMIGADECTCNEDLNYIADTATTTNVDCVCDPLITPEITLTDYTTTPIPINSALTWDVSPACAFEGVDNYEIYMAPVSSSLPSIAGGSSSTTSFSLTGYTPLPNYNIEYDWKIIAKDGGDSIAVADPPGKTFTVEEDCLAKNLEITNTSVSYGSTVGFSWDSLFGSCNFDKYQLSINGGGDNIEKVYGNTQSSVTNFDISVANGFSEPASATAYTASITPYICNDPPGCTSTSMIPGSTSNIVTLTVDPPSATCGNKIIETGETCDDNNATTGDGCDSSCKVETGWYCYYDGGSGHSLCVTIETFEVEGKPIIALNGSYEYKATILGTDASTHDASEFCTWSEASAPIGEFEGISNFKPNAVGLTTLGCNYINGDPATPLDVTVQPFDFMCEELMSGHNDLGGNCWIVAADNTLSCDYVCGNSVDALPESSLTCADPAGDWNVEPICSKLKPTGTYSFLSSLVPKSWAPAIITGTYCRNSSSTTSCSATPATDSATDQRICKCVVPTYP